MSLSNETCMCCKICGEGANGLDGINKVFGGYLIELG